MKDFTSSNSRSNKRLLSSLSPTEDKQTKKPKHQVVKNKENKNLDAMDKDMAMSNEGTELDNINKEGNSSYTSVNSGNRANNADMIKHKTNEITNCNLEGVLGPLVQEIKLL